MKASEYIPLMSPTACLSLAKFSLTIAAVTDALGESEAALASVTFGKLVAPSSRAFKMTWTCCMFI